LKVITKVLIIFDGVAQTKHCCPWDLLEMFCCRYRNAKPQFLMGLLVLLLCVPYAMAVIIISIRVNRVNGFSALPMPKTAIGHAHTHLCGA